MSIIARPGGALLGRWPPDGRPLRDTWGIARRDLRGAFGAQGIMVFAVSPLLFLFGFALLFGRLLGGATPYGQYLTPAIAALCGLFIGQDAGNQLAADRRDGLLARYRTLPIWPGAILASRFTTDAARALGAVVVTVLAGHLFGFRFAAGSAAALAFAAIAVAFGVALASLGAALGVAPPRVQALQPIIFLPLLLMFQFSTAFVPLEEFPGWLRPVAAASPFSAVIGALRALATGGPTLVPVWQALTWTAVLVAICGTIAAWTLRRAT